MPRPRGLEAFDLGGAVLLVYDVGSAPASRDPLARLTNAERSVVELALAGLDNAAIAERTGRSRHTVSNLLRRAYRRFGVGSRIELAGALERIERVPPLSTDV